jgi:hypothetical protein
VRRLVAVRCAVATVVIEVTVKPFTVCPSSLLGAASFARLVQVLKVAFPTKTSKMGRYVSRLSLSSPHVTTREPTNGISWNLRVYSCADFADTSQLWLKFDDKGHYMKI